MHVCTLQLPDGNALACEWRPNPHWSTCIMTVDLFITRDLSSDADPGPNLLNLDRNAPITSFIQDQRQLASPGGPKSAVIKLIVPTKGGYVVRSDLLEFRLHGCLLATRAASFSQQRRIAARRVLADGLQEDDGPRR
ncbi:hypothetical protein CPLU01_08189 [Colletotrichum plurivorum]|uniref:Uncharacterized protein n=1 Tax=Colletotrichum plurivorum TaxID=2175906 RepID=A0A8H6KCJ5_9PEZI|nr:hypothetical protein CPLU01_08189 [Colletotrichum plurivorum]